MGSVLRQAVQVDAGVDLFDTAHQFLAVPVLKLPQWRRRRGFCRFRRMDCG
jgi:hypothetical protein